MQKRNVPEKGSKWIGGEGRTVVIICLASAAAPGLPVDEHDDDDGEVDGLIVVDGGDGAVDNEEMATITGAPPT